MRILIAILAAFLLAAAPAHAAGDLDVGGVRVTIGADKAELLESLRERFKVSEIRSDVYLVSRGDVSAGTVGVVQFRDDALVWASRDVGAFEGQEVRKFAQALFNLLAALHDQDRAPIFITTAVNTNQAFAVGSITLEFPGRRVVVDVAYDDVLVDASIEEILVGETPEQPPGEDVAPPPVLVPESERGTDEDRVTGIPEPRVAAVAAP